MNEANRPSPLGTTLFDSMLGLAVRRWCAPVLDLDPHVPADDYLTRRRELGAAEVNRRLLTETGISTFLVDTGLTPELLTSPEELAALCGATQPRGDPARGGRRGGARRGHVAGRVRVGGPGAAAGIRRGRRQEHRGLSRGAAAPGTSAQRRGPDGRPVRRTTFRRPPHRTPGGQRLAGVDGGRARDAVAVPRGVRRQRRRPRRVRPAAADRVPARDRRNAACPVLLLHNYPFHRNAAYLAQVFDHVFMDVGLATHNAGALSPTLVRESLELVPFGKFLFSSDAYGLAELYHLAALLFRRGLTRCPRRARRRRRDDARGRRARGRPHRAEGTRSAPTDLGDADVPG